MEQTSVFELRQVNRNEAGREILTNASLTIGAGEFVALLGPSGAGKTTILRLFNALDSPDSGEIRFRGERLDQVPVRDLRQKVGMVFQTPAILEGSVRENLLVFQRWQKDFTISDEEIHQILIQVGLENTRPDQAARSLSGGEKQRLALARTLMNEPEVLLLDEPTSNLDPVMAHQILRQIKTLQEEMGFTVIMVSHNHELAARYADRFVILLQGQIAADGPLSVLKTAHSPAVQTFLNGGGE
ncbi:MAG: ATP-binding cassette domain-containing protein [Candidatus Marinimicrobia bacterium]|nr:ATP-binding cassette domain-containing protein [Candidatus Neomarinimicrobiota bacterium]MCF7840463.1 ATP-binding cassette domain-containing protein [Candidatus Neomarinimicrobiota bacterium]MCF7903260.1 ATP-binding cassette domain-containing protein [Candidatus Neomarinimicrobiota bacterium]